MVPGRRTRGHGGESREIQEEEGLQESREVQEEGLQESRRRRHEMSACVHQREPEAQGSVAGVVYEVP